MATARNLTTAISSIAAVSSESTTPQFPSVAPVTSVANPPPPPHPRAAKPTRIRSSPPASPAERFVAEQEVPRAGPDPLQLDAGTLFSTRK